MHNLLCFDLFFRRQFLFPADMRNFLFLRVLARFLSSSCDAKLFCFVLFFLVIFSFQLIHRRVWVFFCRVHFLSPDDIYASRLTFQLNSYDANIRIGGFIVSGLLDKSRLTQVSSAVPPQYMLLDLYLIFTPTRALAHPVWRRLPYHTGDRIARPLGRISKMIFFLQNVR